MVSNELLEAPESHGHLVQLYGSDERPLIRNVSKFLAEGLNDEEALLLVATPAHTESFLAGVRAHGTDPDTAKDDGRIVVLDAQETLASFMRDRHPDSGRFDETVGALVRRMTSQGRPVRAYGEMVGLLWTAGQVSAAIRLEQLWNDLLSAANFRLYCSYPIDVFHPDFAVRGVDAVLDAHSHLVPTCENGSLTGALNRGMDAVLGGQAREIRPRIRANYRPSSSVPEAEATILWLRQNLPDHAEEILVQARDYFNTR